MSKLFFDHLIEMGEITAILDVTGLNEKERTQLLKLVDKTMNHHILDEILSHLPVEHHKDFLEQLAHAPHDKKLLTRIKKLTPGNIEEAIRSRGKEVIKQIAKEIMNAKKTGGDAG